MPDNILAVIVAVGITSSSRSMRVAGFRLAFMSMIMASMVIALLDRVVSMFVVVVMVMVMVMIVVVVVIMEWSSSSRGDNGCAASGGDACCGRVVMVVAIVFSSPLLQDIEVLYGVVQASVDLDRALRGGEGCGRDEKDSGQCCGL